LRNRASGIGAVDLLVVPTINFRLLFVLVILQHERRRVILLSVTDHPTAEWIVGQITEAFPWDSAPTHLIRDRDACYGGAFKRRLAAMGIRDHPIAPRSPWQNGHAERLIGSIRRECLDHIVIFGEVHLRQVLKAYAAYYNHVRTHLALTRTRRFLVLSTGLVTSLQSPSSANSIMNTVGSDFRQGHSVRTEQLPRCPHRATLDVARAVAREVGPGQAGSAALTGAGITPLIQLAAQQAGNSGSCNWSRRSASSKHFTTIALPLPTG
jgi:hypothetical protein